MTDTNFELKKGADAKRVSAGIKHASLFTGIGGFDLAASWMGWENMFQVEINAWCRKVLEKNFPNVKRYADIKESDFQEWENKIDILSGGFPCQPFSVAGKRKGNEDERALWFEMYRTIKQVKPLVVVAENVPGLLTIDGGMVFEQVCIDLENAGYEVQPFIIPAASKNAIHKRDRIWIVAFASSQRCNNGQDNRFRRHLQKNEGIATENKQERHGWLGGVSEISSVDTNLTSTKHKISAGHLLTGMDENFYTDTDISRQQKRRAERGAQGQLTSDFSWSIESAICREDDGIPNWVDRIKGLGNAIVPQVAFEIYSSVDFCIKSGAFFNSKFVFDKAV